MRNFSRQDIKSSDRTVYPPLKTRRKEDPELAKLQRQLIEAQQKIIELQQRLDAITPKNVPDEKIFWHLASGGIMSEEAANSNDVVLVRKFRKWNIDFAKHYIKPYVNPSVYGECLNQMTRGLNARIVDLENNPPASKPVLAFSKTKRKSKKSTPIVEDGQLELMS